MCSYPMYGEDCQSICECNVTYCDHVNGCIQSSGKTLYIVHRIFLSFISYVFIQIQYNLKGLCNLMGSGMFPFYVCNVLFSTFCNVSQVTRYYEKKP